MYNLRQFFQSGRRNNVNRETVEETFLNICGKLMITRRMNGSINIGKILRAISSLLMGLLFFSSNIVSVVDKKYYMVILMERIQLILIHLFKFFLSAKLKIITLYQ